MGTDQNLDTSAGCFACQPLLQSHACLSQTVSREISCTASRNSMRPQQSLTTPAGALDPCM